jgi:NAD(P)-dependent dehydrogenase (short-subunit alcohol dehydrogenase family)
MCGFPMRRAVDPQIRQPGACGTGQAAVVTGYKRCGKRYRSEAHAPGVKVFITSRLVGEQESIDPNVTAIRCDHRDDSLVQAAFEKIGREAPAIDILVNNVWAKI